MCVYARACMYVRYIYIYTFIHARVYTHTKKLTLNVVSEGVVCPMLLQPQVLAASNHVRPCIHIRV